MKKTVKFFGITVAILTSVLFLTGCASLMHRVRITTEGNLSSVLAGGTLNMRASGRNIVWIVSSSVDGSSPTGSGTFITPDGRLTVAANEPASILYVIARSTEDDFSDVRQIRVVTVTGVTVSPGNQSVVIGRSSQFRAHVAGHNNPDNAVTWRVSSNAAGTGTVSHGTGITAHGVLTVAPHEPLRTIYVIATSRVDPSMSGSVFATVVVPTVTRVTVNTGTPLVIAGSTRQFWAYVIGTFDPDPAVIWSVSSNAAGTRAVTPGTWISGNGVLTVAANETVSTLFVFATSVFDPMQSGSIAVSVMPAPIPPPAPPPLTPAPTPTPPPTTPAPTPPPPAPAVPIVTGITISPSSHSTLTNRNVQLHATVTGINNPNTAVTWSVSSNAAGTGAVAPRTIINANGLLTVAPNEWSPTLHVVATSVADPTRTASAIVTVTNANPNQGPNQGR